MNGPACAKARSSRKTLFITLAWNLVRLVSAIFFFFFFLNGRLAVRTVERDFKHETTAFVNPQALASLRRIFKRLNRNWIKLKLNQWNAMNGHSPLCTNAGESSVNVFLREMI